MPLADATIVDDDDLPVGDLFDRALLPAIRVVAERLALDLKIAPGVSLPSLGAPDLNAAARTGALNHDLLHLAATTGLGLVRYHLQVRPACLFAQLAAAFPNRRLMAVAARDRDCRKIKRECIRHGIPAYRIDRRKNVPRALPRVVIATAGQGVRVNPRQIDLLVLAHAREALNVRFEIDQYYMLQSVLDTIASVGEPDEDRQSPLIHCYRSYCPRRIGLLPVGECLAPSERHRLNRVFGFEEVTIFPDGHVPPRVVVEQIRVRRCPNIPRRADALTRLRTGLWWHGDRNRALCRRARRAAAEGQRVLVLADSLEHAALLADRLPGWPFRAAVTGSLCRLPSRLRPAVRRSRPDANGPHLMTTLTAAVALNLASFDVIIRADGGVGGLPGLTAPPGVPAGSNHRVTLADCFDRFDYEARQQSNQRFREYRKAGWLAMGATNIVTEKARKFVEEVRFDERRFDFD